MKEVKCDKCGALVRLTSSIIRHTKTDDYDTVFLFCPTCGHKYHIMTTDSEMRASIQKRAKQEAAVAYAKSHNFTKKTIARLSNSLAATKRYQKEREDDLREIGRKILNDLPEGEDEEHTAEQS